MQDGDKTLVQQSPFKDKAQFTKLINQSSQKVQKLTCLDEKSLIEQVEQIQTKINTKFQILDEMNKEKQILMDRKFNLPSFDPTIHKVEQMYLDCEKEISEAIDQRNKFK